MRKRYLFIFFLLGILFLSVGVLAWVSEVETHYQANTATVQPPKNTPSPDVFRFAALGDMGTGDSNQRAIARQMASFQSKHPFDTVLMLGDNIYPEGDPAEFGTKFEHPYAELLQRGVQFYAVLGNHDVKHGRQAEMNYPPFHMNGHAYYSFVRGNGLVEFFAIDTTSLDGKELQWLKNALVNSKARWKIAYFHTPIYSSGRTHGSNLKKRAFLEPLFVRYGVAAVFAGHDHIYERTKLEQGVEYFVSGAGGQLREGDINRSDPIFEAGNDQVNSFMYLEVTPDQMAFWALDASGNILDQGTLAPPQPSPKRKR